MVSQFRADYFSALTFKNQSDNLASQACSLRGRLVECGQLLRVINGLHHHAWLLLHHARLHHTWLHHTWLHHAWLRLHTWLHHAWLRLHAWLHLHTRLHHDGLSGLLHHHTGLLLHHTRLHLIRVLRNVARHASRSRLSLVDDDGLQWLISDVA